MLVCMCVRGVHRELARLAASCHVYRPARAATVLQEETATRHSNVSGHLNPKGITAIGHPVPYL